MEPSQFQFLSALLAASSAARSQEDRSQPQPAPKSNASARAARGSVSIVSPLAATPSSGSAVAAAPAPAATSAFKCTYTGAMLNRAYLASSVAAAASHSLPAPDAHAGAGAGAGAGEEQVHALLVRLRPALERKRLPFHASFFVALVHSVRYAMCALSQVTVFVFAALYKVFCECL